MQDRVELTLDLLMAMADDLKQMESSQVWETAFAFKLDIRNADLVRQRLEHMLAFRRLQTFFAEQEGKALDEVVNPVLDDLVAQLGIDTIVSGGEAIDNSDPSHESGRPNSHTFQLRNARGEAIAIHQETWENWDELLEPACAWKTGAEAVRFERLDVAFRRKAQTLYDGLLINQLGPYYRAVLVLRLNNLGRRINKASGQPWR